jgi:3-hydroxybutyryl-CoA dehydratase
LQSTRSVNWFSSLGEAQKRFWHHWFELLNSTSFSRSMQMAGLWQSSLEVFRKSVEVSLQVQQDTAQLLQGVAGYADTLKAQSAHMAKTAVPQTLDIGMSASLSKQIDEMDIVAFASLSGDINPVHLVDSYAEQTRFKGRIAHGMLSAGLISAVLGTKLPGPGTIYLSQNLRFKAPVAVGDTITATATITAQKEGKPIYTLETICTNQEGVTVLEGEAVILYDPVR